MSSAVVVTSYIDGHVDAGDLGRAREGSRSRARAARRLPVADDIGDLGHDLFAFAEHGGVDEVGERLGVEGGVPADDHERVARAAVGGVERDAGEVDHLEHVREDQLGREVEGEDVEVARRAVGVDREQRQPRSRAAHDRGRSQGA